MDREEVFFIAWTLLVYVVGSVMGFWVGQPDPDPQTAVPKVIQVIGPMNSGFVEVRDTITIIMDGTR